MVSNKKVILLVLDSVGIGALPDAAEYNSLGTNTLLHIDEGVGGLELPNLEKLGLGNIADFLKVQRRPDCIANFGKMAEKSRGKDTTTGHWELCGSIITRQFPLYPEGFPQDLLDRISKEAFNGRGIIGNKPASGTDIIQELGQEQWDTGKIIVYTSSDSVFQVAANEELIPLEELYDMCEKARRIMIGEHKVIRVIARPFAGQPGNFYRTSGRKDYSVEPESETILDRLSGNGVAVLGVGKIADIMAHRGISEDHHVTGNDNIANKTIELSAANKKPAFIFSNLVDFDMVYGHRNDVPGYAKALKSFDDQIPSLLETLDGDSLLIITADHGCDPTTPGIDHDREYVPLLVYAPGLKSGTDLGIRSSFADAGETILDYFGLPPLDTGTSFLPQLQK